MWILSLGFRKMMVGFCLLGIFEAKDDRKAQKRKTDCCHVSYDHVLHYLGKPNVLLIFSSIFF